MLPGSNTFQLNILLYGHINPFIVSGTTQPHVQAHTEKHVFQVLSMGYVAEEYETQQTKFRIKTPELKCLLIPAI